MPQNLHLEIVSSSETLRPAPPPTRAPDEAILGRRALELARSLDYLPNVPSSNLVAERWQELLGRLQPLLASLERPLPRTPFSDDYRWLHDNASLVASESSPGNALAPLFEIPHVRDAAGRTIPQILVIAEGFLAATNYQFSESAFTAYVQGFQEITDLKIKELWGLIPAFKLVLLEQVVARGSELIADPTLRCGVDACIRSLREITQISWKEALEQLIVVDRLLRADPVGVYAGMDFDSRDLYRNQVIRLAQYSGRSEKDVALEALALARSAQSGSHPDPRVIRRCSHVGYYLVAEGAEALEKRLRFRPPFTQRLEAFLRAHPDEFYLPGTAILTFAILSVTLLLLTAPYSSPGLVLLAMLVLLLPSSQSAVQLMGYLTTSLLTPQILPKFDFSEGLPDDCMSMVAIPTLLLNETQVRHLVDDLEVRFLGNHDRNLHFALVSDLPDSAEPPNEDDALVHFCAEQIAKLNEKYAGQGMGSFFLFHRHRIYNPRERVWMGWERKRGKLLDLNKLLRQQYDSFPVKVGNLSILEQVRFVITLDSDTELPRGSAHRMIGALAHPLNQAIIDPQTNIVVAGYGILQPRVGISVQSASRSRLAKIYSGQTGIDIYTRAVSDIYQDLYGEGSFTGKGIYEVDTLHKVFDRRFPDNALLSHDLIEGSYARAGLVTDIEIIEDYPSHYSAHNRRKHRWLRGDWQIAEWLTSRVPAESGNRVANPISLISQWKILDNLRRSLVEPATFLLFLLGWLVLPGSPFYWTLATVVILFLPAWSWSGFQLIRAVLSRDWATARGAIEGLFSANVGVLLILVFLAHQMLLSLDAMVRALVRQFVTEQRLLEWETAAQAELGGQRRTPLDVYLDWQPALAIGLALLLWFARPGAFSAAVPILALWAGSKPISVWLNRSPLAPRAEASEKEKVFLRSLALRTWRYFAEFSNEEHHWLIPDNVQEDPPAIVAKLSPTNLGLLLNSSQVACEFGFLTVPEFAERVSRTLATYAALEKYRGHLYNWYDTRTLQPMPPLFVSTVDSGNLVASLWALEEGSLDQLHKPLFPRALADGLLDHLRMLFDQRAYTRKRLAAFEREISGENWLQALVNLPEVAVAAVPRKSGAKSEADARWWGQQALTRLTRLQEEVRLYTPWLLPEFAGLRNDPAIALPSLWNEPKLDELSVSIDALEARLEAADESGQQKVLYGRLHALLAPARARVHGLVEELRTIATRASKLARATDFEFLYNRRRKLLSIGYDADADQLNTACYDLLASEARIGVFVAIAKDDIPQESWFQLGRAHILDHGRPVLLSWTGTMFEYLMPVLWMRSYPGTLLERSRSAAVRAQQAFAAVKRIPWGISESSYFKRDDSGNYGYRAFGVPGLAVHVDEDEKDALVVAPYATFLALHVDGAGALRNLRKMAGKKWVGPYGFYEAVDFTSARMHSWRRRFEVVHCWMAHHQGMSLLSIANFLGDGTIQNWFHSSPRVQATELLLQEKPVDHVLAAKGNHRASVA
ncbi:MAG TPA: glucoamylase family protein [Terriglobales bacterium]|nr:glucoamylase family protein [Terriglobales bacterium]